MPDFKVSTTFSARDKLTNAFKGMGGAVTKFGDKSNLAFRKASTGGLTFGKVLKGVLATSLALKGIDLIKKAIGGLIGEASKLEDATADFTTLTGSIENAEKAIADLNKTAATTPFEFQDLSDATKTLLGFEAATQATLIPTLRMLGDTAGGNAERFKGITLAFSQIQAAGKASMQDVNQLINNGVPILGALAKQWKTTVGEARAMISTGDATGEVVTKAFKAMTSEGGKFHKGMDRASKTLSGRFSTFTDNVKLTAASLGTNLLPQLKKVVDFGIKIAGKLRTWAEANQEIIGQRFEDMIKRTVIRAKELKPFLKDLITGFKILLEVFRFLKPILPVLIGGLIAYGVAMRAIQLFQFIAMVRKAIVVQGLFNVVMSANPVGLIIIGIAALIAIIILMVKHWDKVKEVVGFTIDFWGKQLDKLWDKMKVGFTVVFNVIKKIFFNFADVYFSILGAIVKAVVKTASKVGKALGFDTTGLDKVINTIDKLQAEVKLRAEAPIIPPNREEARAQVSQFNGRLDIAGAPEGSQVTTQQTGAFTFDIGLLGANH